MRTPLQALPLTLVFVAIGWFLIIRPQQQRAKAQRAVVEALETGDRVISAGGIHGTLTQVDPETVGLEVAPGVVLTVARPAIARRIEVDKTPETGDVTSPTDDPTTDDPT